MGGDVKNDEVILMLSFEQKIDNFTALLRNTAEDSGEGNELETDTFLFEDVSGWLIPFEMQKEFIKTEKKDRRNSRWSEFFCFAEWRKDGEEIQINFNKYPIYIDEPVSIIKQ